MNGAAGPAGTPIPPYLIGESNPYGADPRYALYPLPERSAGGRLCRLIVRMPAHDYIAYYRRFNLCSGSWRMKEARKTAEATLAEVRRIRSVARCRGEAVYPPKLVLLGAKVSEAFGIVFEPFTVYSGTWCDYIMLPHPSGLNRLWNEPGSYDRAHALLVKHGAVPVAS